MNLLLLLETFYFNSSYRLRLKEALKRFKLN